MNSETLLDAALAIAGVVALAAGLLLVLHLA